jgi:cytolysin-activating lysine-acyltransferase
MPQKINSDKENIPNVTQKQRQVTQAIIEQKRRFVLIGEVTTLLLQSPLHLRYAFYHIATRIIPALKLNQYKMYYSNLKPVGMIVYARLSEEAETRYKNGLGKVDLRKEDWNSGDRLWFIEFVALPGYLLKIKNDLRNVTFPNEMAQGNRIDSKGQFCGHIKVFGKNWLKNKKS